MAEKRQWLRLYADIVDDDKLGLLAFQDRWHFVALLALKASGLLDVECDPNLKRRRIAGKLGITELELEELARRLSEVDLIDRKTLQPIAWDRRQFETDSSAERTRHWRERKKAERDGCDSHSDVTVTPPDTDTDTERAKESALRAEGGIRDANPAPVPTVNGNHEQQSPTDADNRAKDAAPDAKRCPVREIVAVYHDAFPGPHCMKLTRTVTGYVRQRWLEDLPSLDDFRNYFEYAAKSRFLAGKCEGRDGKPPFVADLEWLMRPGNYAKVAQGKYHRG